MLRAWDFLFFLLVLAPALTGGIWKREGARFIWEYTQPGPAALVLAIWLWWLARRGHPVASGSLFCRAGRRAWCAWRDGLARFPGRTLTAAWLFVSAVWLTTSLLRHRGFGSGLADLSIFVNGIWNVGEQGYPYSSIKDGLSLLADHQIYLLYPLGWLFRLWPAPEFLLLMQALGLASGGVALYLLARQRVGEGSALAAFLPLAFWLGLPVRNVNRFDFHPEAFMLPLFLFGAWLLQEEKWGKRAAGLFLFLCALAAKESAGPVACGLGLAWMLGAGPEPTRRFTRLFGAWAIVLGFVVFYVDSQVVPKGFGRAYAYGDLYAPFGSSPAQLLSAPFTQPLEFFGRLFDWRRVKYFVGANLPYAGLPLLSPFAWISSAPGWLMLFLTNGDHRISLQYHYVVEPLVGLLFAVPGVLATAFARRRERWLLIALVLGTALSFGRSEAFFWRIYQVDSHKAWVRGEVLPLVRGDVTLSASYALTPHLSTRRWINQLPMVLIERQHRVDCVVWDRAVNNTPMGTDHESMLAMALRDWEYVRELSCGSLAVYRNPAVPSCFTAPPPPCPEAQ